MEQRYWYGLDQLVNPLGVGCWQLAGEHYINGRPNGWGAMGKQDAIRLVHAALDNGLQFFDTAAGYGNGRSEEILGNVFSQSANHSGIVVCTKIPLSENEVAALSPGNRFIEKVEQCITRLKRERIDVLLLHNPPDTVDWNNFDTHMFTQLQKAGKIGTFGVSSRSIDGAMKVVDAGFGSCIEWILNLLERRPIDTIFPKLQHARMNFIARSPLSRGLLAPKYVKHDPVFSPDDFRSTLPANWIDWVLKSIRKLHLPDEEISRISKYALHFCLSFKEVSAVIPGIKKLEHITTGLLPDDEQRFYESFVHKLFATTEKSYPGWS